MAIIKKGSLLDGASGRIGDLVFRTRGDRTIVSQRPGRRDPGLPRSARLKKTLTRFQEAVRFAREARHKNSFRSLSRTLRGYSPYHIALQDFLSIPVIESVDAGGVGHRGGEVVVRVAERVAVRSVRVKLTGKSGDDIVRPDPVAIPNMQRVEASMPSALASQSRTIPAQLFFKRASEKARTDTRSQPDVSEADAEPVGSGPLELRATRHLVVARDPEDGQAADRLEMWRVALPRAGEITIIASDYAGNRTARTLHVGPEAT